MFQLKFWWLTIKFFVRIVLLRRGTAEEFHQCMMSLSVNREIQRLRLTHPDATAGELEAMAREAIGLKLLEYERKFGKRG